MAFLKMYLYSFYKSAGLLHMMPSGEDMDYTGNFHCVHFEHIQAGVTTQMTEPSPYLHPERPPIGSLTRAVNAVYACGGCG